MNKKIILISAIIIIAMLILSFILFDDWFRESEGPVTLNPSTQTQNKDLELSIKLYFANEDANSLSAVDKTVTVKNKDDVYKTAITELIKGPDNTSLYPTLDKSTQLNTISVKDKLATVDFSSSFIEKNTGGSSKELICLYSVVNTLCSFDEIDKVVITVDGHQIETFGQYDMTEPYEANLSLIK